MSNCGAYASSGLGMVSPEHKRNTIFERSQVLLHITLRLIKYTKWMLEPCKHAIKDRFYEAEPAMKIYSEMTI